MLNICYIILHNNILYPNVYICLPPIASLLQQAPVNIMQHV